MRRYYSELKELKTLEERYEYLRVRGRVGDETFGMERYINQKFYRSKEWRDIRHEVIVRDLACDLGVQPYSISSRIIIHHINPMTPANLIDGDAHILDPEFLICCSHQTHNAIHYGDRSLLPQDLVTRAPGDTLPW